MNGGKRSKANSTDKPPTAAISNAGCVMDSAATANGVTPTTSASITNHGKVCDADGPSEPALVGAAFIGPFWSAQVNESITTV